MSGMSNPFMVLMQPNSHPMVGQNTAIQICSLHHQPLKYISNNGATQYLLCDVCLQYQSCFSPMIQEMKLPQTQEIESIPIDNLSNKTQQILKQQKEVKPDNLHSVGAQNNVGKITQYPQNQIYIQYLQDKDQQKSTLSEQPTLIQLSYQIGQQQQQAQIPKVLSLQLQQTQQPLVQQNHHVVNTQQIVSNLHLKPLPQQMKPDEEISDSSNNKQFYPSIKMITSNNKSQAKNQIDIISSIAPKSSKSTSSDKQEDREQSTNLNQQNYQINTLDPKPDGSKKSLNQKLNDSHNSNPPYQVKKGDASTQQNQPYITAHKNSSLGDVLSLDHSFGQNNSSIQKTLSNPNQIRTQQGIGIKKQASENNQQFQESLNNHRKLSHSSQDSIQNNISESLNTFERVPSASDKIIISKNNNLSIIISSQTQIMDEVQIKLEEGIPHGSLSIMQKQQTYENINSTSTTASIFGNQVEQKKLVFDMKAINQNAVGPKAMEEENSLSISNSLSAEKDINFKKAISPLQFQKQIRKEKTQRDPQKDYVLQTIIKKNHKEPTHSSWNSSNYGESMMEENQISCERSATSNIFQYGHLGSNRNSAMIEEGVNYQADSTQISYGEGFNKVLDSCNLTETQQSPAKAVKQIMSESKTNSRDRNKTNSTENCPKEDKQKIEQQDLVYSSDHIVDFWYYEDKRFCRDSKNIYQIEKTDSIKTVNMNNQTITLLKLEKKQTKQQNLEFVTGTSSSGIICLQENKPMYFRFYDKKYIEIPNVSSTQKNSVFFEINNQVYKCSK